MSIHTFLELERRPDSGNNTGCLVNINEVVEVFDNDKDQIGVYVIDRRNGSLTQYRLSKVGTDRFRHVTGTVKTHHVILEQERAERQRSYDQ